MKKFFIAVLGALIFCPVILPQNNFMPVPKVFAAEKSVDDLYKEGVEFIGDKNYKAALKSLNKAAKIDPEYLPAWVALTTAYVNLGREDDAAKNLKKAIELNQNNTENLSFLAVLLFTFDKSQGIEILKDIVKNNPDNAANWKILGAGYSMLEDYDNALKNLQKSLELNPNDAETWNVIAGIYDTLNNFDSAVEYSKKAVELDPNNAGYLNNLGVIYARRGDFANAIDCLKKAISLNPQEASYWSSLGRCYELQENFTEAKNCYSKAVELDSETEEFKTRLANVSAKVK